MTQPVADAALPDVREQVQELIRLNQYLQAQLDERQQAENAFRRLIEGATVAGGDFFPSLVHNLARALEVKYAFVTEYVNSARTRAQLLAVWMGNTLGPNPEYEVEGTPGGTGEFEKMLFYERDVQRFFPNDKLLATLQAESYWGVPLVNSAGEVIGHLAVADDHPAEIKEQARQEAILKLFAIRATAELERKRAEDALRLIMEVMVSATGKDFFNSLVYHLASALQARYAFVAQYTNTAKTHVQTLAFWKDQALADNFEYALQGTPCETVLTGIVSGHSHSVQALFPLDHKLATFSAQSDL